MIALYADVKASSFCNTFFSVLKIESGLGIPSHWIMGIVIR